MRPAAGVFAGLVVVLALAGCTNQGDCPAKPAIAPGGACNDETLQCAYDLASPSQACDGSQTTLATSCICTDGVWQCPEPFGCGAGGAGGAGSGGGGGGGGMRTGGAGGH